MLNPSILSKDSKELSQLFNESSFYQKTTIINNFLLLLYLFWFSIQKS